MKINNLNILRLFAITLVVLRHSFAPFTKSWDISKLYQYSESADILGQYIATISMPLFVFISGLLYSYLRNDLNKYPTHKILFRKKTKRLIRPYLFLAPLYIYLFSDANSFSTIMINLWKGTGHLWFLLMIFTVFMIFYPLEQFFKKKIPYGIIVVLALFILYPLFWRLDLFPIARAFKYLPFFFLGYFFYLKNTQISSMLRGKFWVLFLIHLLVFTITLRISDLIENIQLIYLFKILITIPLGFLSISFLYLLIEKLGEIKDSRLIKSIGNVNEMSYYIYIFHQPLLLVFFESKVFQKWEAQYVIILSFLFSFLTSLIVSNIIMNQKLGRKLIGA